MKASDIMAADVICLNADTDITRAVEVLLNNHINGAPVVDAHDELVGILCQSDLIFQQKKIPVPPIFTILDGIIPLSSSKKLDEEFKKMAATCVGDAMVREVTTVEPDTPVAEIASLMVEKHFHTIPVVQNRKILGIIGKEDILKTLIPSTDGKAHP